MDQIKIGAFIAECRKAQGYTQALLAEQLHITNKAVSKWECGRSLPDAAIMLGLCKLLNITVTELLEGERDMERNEMSGMQETLMAEKSVGWKQADNRKT